MEEHEITLRVTVSMEELVELLKKNGYKEKNEFLLDDVYLIPKEFSDIDKYDERRLLNMSVRIRSYIMDSNPRNELVKKDKEFDDDNQIIKETKYICRIQNIDEAHSLLKSLGYIELLRIQQKAYTFKNEKYEMVVSHIDGRTYIELENHDEQGNVLFNSPSEMINFIKEYKIPHVENEFFAQKAVDEIRIMRENNRK